MQSIVDVPAYVICLEKKKDTRCDVNFNSIKDVFPKAKWTEAVDAADIPEDDDRISVFARYHIKTTEDTDYLHLSSKGAIGCTLSHVGLWEKVVETNTPSIIVEDDMNLSTFSDSIKTAYKNIPSNVEYASILYLPWPASKVNIFDSSTTYLPFNVRDNISGTQLYYITPKGASILLKYAFPIVAHVDSYIGYVANVINEFNAVYYATQLYPLHKMIEDDIASSIQHKVAIKKMMPDSDAFYWCAFGVYIALIISVIILTCRKRS